MPASPAPSMEIRSVRAVRDVDGEAVDDAKLPRTCAVLKYAAGSEPRRTTASNSMARGGGSGGASALARHPSPRRPESPVRVPGTAPTARGEHPSVVKNIHPRAGSTPHPRDVFLLAMRTRAFALVVTFLVASPVTARVRLVCNGSRYRCPPGTGYRNISSALVHAAPGDWVLVWPGVYHEKSGEAGVLITTPNVHLRGMDRNLVIVDGSNGTAAAPCPADPALQDLTPRNGIEVFKTSGTSIENLT